MRKSLVRIVVTVVILLALLLVIASIWSGSVVRKSINTLGPVAMGVPVSVDSVSVNILRGHARLGGLHVGNPEGFKTKSLFDAERIEVDLDMASLFTDTIVIRRILVLAPQVTFERGLLKSNLSALLEQLGGGQEVPPQKDEKPGKNVVIDELTLSDGKVRLSVTAAMGLAAPIALAEVRMTNIGREEGAKGLGLPQIIRLIVGTVLKSVVNAIGGLGSLAVDTIKATGNGILKAGEAVVDTVKPTK